MNKQFGKRLLAAVLSVSLVGGGYPSLAGAALVGTEEVLTAQTRAEDSARVAAFLSREDVVGELERFGVAPEAAQARVDAMSDQELARLAGEIETLPAGAGAIEVIGIVFLVLLILELVGVTNIFHSP